MPQKHTLETAVALLRKARAKLQEARMQLQEKTGKAAYGMSSEMQWTSVEHVLGALRTVVSEYESIECSLRFHRMCSAEENKELNALAERMGIDQ